MYPVVSPGKRRRATVPEGPCMKPITGMGRGYATMPLMNPERSIAQGHRDSVRYGQCTMPGDGEMHLCNVCVIDGRL